MSRGVYAIRNHAERRLYVGNSYRIEVRWLMHIAGLRTGRHHCVGLQAAWDRCQPADFDIVILGLDSEQEAEWMKRCELAWPGVLYNASIWHPRPAKPAPDVFAFPALDTTLPYRCYRQRRPRTGTSAASKGTSLPPVATATPSGGGQAMSRADVADYGEWRKTQPPRGRPRKPKAP